MGDENPLFLCIPELSTALDPGSPGYGGTEYVGAARFILSFQQLHGIAVRPRVCRRMQGRMARYQSMLHSKFSSCIYCLDYTTLDARTVRLPQVQHRPWGLLHFYWHNLVQCMGHVMGSAGSRLYRTRCALRCCRLEGPSERPVRFAGAIWGSVS
jgi:hypothetical protein